jgi:hypothetical protein
VITPRPSWLDVQQQASALGEETIEMWPERWWQMLGVQDLWPTEDARTLWPSAWSTTQEYAIVTAKIYPELAKFCLGHQKAVIDYPPPATLLMTCQLHTGTLVWVMSCMSSNKRAL